MRRLNCHPLCRVVKWDNGRITHVRPDILAVITAEEPTP